MIHYNAHHHKENYVRDKVNYCCRFIHLLRYSKNLVW